METIMTTALKAFIIAFSMYSQIPMPQFTWQEKEMKYAFCFFPWVGAAIGGITMFWWWFCGKFSVGNMAFAMIVAAIPLAVTGGFHVDGFMDTMDAFHSYQPRERKLEILKDSHIGAFSVICLVLYELIYIGAYSEINAVRQIEIAAVGFFLSRCLSGIAAVTFPGAKKEGLLYMFTSRAHERTVKAALFLQTLSAAVLMLYIDGITGAAALVGAGITFWYYYKKCKKELGGITGDTEGYFVTVCEGVIVLAAAVCKIVLI